MRGLLVCIAVLVLVVAVTVDAGRRSGKGRKGRHGQPCVNDAECQPCSLPVPGATYQCGTDGRCTKTYQSCDSDDESNPCPDGTVCDDDDDDQSVCRPLKVTCTSEQVGQTCETGAGTGICERKGCNRNNGAATEIYECKLPKRTCTNVGDDCDACPNANYSFTDVCVVKNSKGGGTKNRCERQNTPSQDTNTDTANDGDVGIQ